MNKNRLSHSAVSKYADCPKSYEYHYQHKLRSKYQSSALFFGSAFDNAINVLLKDENKDPYNVFDYSFRFADVNGNREFLPKSFVIVYSNSDFDADLLKPEDYVELEKELQIHGKDALLELYKSLSDAKKQKSWNMLSIEDKSVYNLFNWHSLRRKAHVMIDTYKSEVMPHIKKVHTVQRYIKLENDEGDEIIGYVDAVLDWKDEGTVIFDLKTSSIDYEEDSVLTSPQLTLYTNALSEEFKTRKAGYLIIHKRVDKNKIKICSICKFDGSGARHKTCSNESSGIRCGGEWTETINPTVRVQVIIDEIPARTEEIVLQNYADINNGIKNKHFVRNFSSCMKPWGPCVYRDLCFKNDDSSLVKMDDKKKLT